MLSLCSNGLTSEKLISCVKGNDRKTAAIVVTADPEYKENNYHVPRVIEELKRCNPAVDIIDTDIDPVGKLLNYDVVMFIGGNPYYLLMSLRKCNAKPVLKEISENKCLIGWSAGALVLCSTIKIIDEYSPEMNLLGLDDLTGMEITNIQILPHYDKFLSRYEGFEEKCCEYEVRNQCKVVRISDGEGLLIENNSISVV